MDFLAPDIGLWVRIIEGLIYVGMVANALILAFSSTYVDQAIIQPLAASLIYHSGEDWKVTAIWGKVAVQLSFVLIYEHILVAFKFAVHLLVPSIPNEVKVLMKREEYMAKVALEGEGQNSQKPEYEDAVGEAPVITFCSFL